MKRIKTLIVAAIALCCVSIPVSAQFKWGIQGGIVANDLKINNSMFDSSNRIGFTGGLTAQFNLMFGLGFQGSVMYVHRTTEVTGTNNGQTVSANLKADYIAVPIHLKYNINLPAINNLFRPYIFTGPSFSYLLSKKEVLNYKLTKGDIEWDLGLGFDIINHIQLSAGYGFGMYKIADFGGGKVRTNSWTVTLGYLF